MDAILKHYPEAITLKNLEQKIVSELNSSRFILSKTIWGTSICSDEVNNTFNSLNTLFAGPGAFRFGGISGLPFTGKTGMLAFIGHIPDEGAAFILYGPHIGVSGEGKIGLINRECQQQATTCCGSLIAGLEAIKNGFTPSKTELLDQQQYQVQEILYSEKETIEKSPNPIKTITEIAFEKSHEQLYKIIELTKEILKGKKLFLMGGIVINTDWDKEDWFEVRETELLNF